MGVPVPGEKKYAFLNRLKSRDGLGWDVSGRSIEGNLCWGLRHVAGDLHRHRALWHVAGPRGHREQLPLVYIQYSDMLYPTTAKRFEETYLHFL